MAKYTQLLAEYLQNGGELPVVFSNIEGFKELFIGKYADHEIGFETPTLFALKLEFVANLVFPEYLKRINDLNRAQELLNSPTKSRIRTGGITRDTGKQTVQNWNMPFNQGNTNAPVAHPTTQQANGERVDKETYNSITDAEEGYSASEAMNYAQSLSGEVGNIKKQLLNEFKNLFMQVY